MWNIFKIFVLTAFKNMLLNFNALQCWHPPSNSTYFGHHVYRSLSIDNNLTSDKLTANCGWSHKKICLYYLIFHSSTSPGQRQLLLGWSRTTLWYCNTNLHNDLGQEVKKNTIFIWSSLETRMYISIQNSVGKRLLSFPVSHSSSGKVVCIVE